MGASKARGTKARRPRGTQGARARVARNLADSERSFVLVTQNQKKT